MELMVLSLALSALSPVQFEAVQVDAALNDHFDLPRYFAGVAPEEFIQAGDLDGDGLTDLIARAPSVSSFFNSWGSVGAWRNIDGRHFERVWQDVFPFSSDLDGQSGYGLADFTGDGILDFAFSKRTTLGGFEGVAFYTGNGDGTFAPQTLVALPPGLVLFNFSAVDYDSDGRSEALVYYRNDQNEIFLTFATLGPGGFSPLAPYSLPANIGLPRVGDFTGDGTLDVLYMETDWVTARILENQNGTLSLWDTLDLPAPPFGNINMRPLVGDLESDGDVDVMFVLQGSGISPTNQVAILENSPSGFGGVTQQATVEDAPSIGGSLVDWDNDGDLDWVGSGQAVTAAENDGSNQFTSSGTSFLSVISFTSPGVLDLDGDGNLDYVGAETAIFGNGDTAIGDFDFSVFPAYTNEDETRLQDVDDDGDQDLVVPASASGFNQFVPRVYFNDASSALTATFESYLGDDPDTGLPYDRYLAEADFDGDCAVEVLTYDRPVNSGGQPVQGDLLLLERNAAGDWVEDGPGGPTKLLIELPPGDGWPAGDVDGDGDLDLFVTDGVHVNVNGSGLLFGKVNAYAGQPLAVLDWDADGDADVLIDASGDLVLLRNQGGFDFKAEVLRSFVGEIVLQTLDLDGDGDLDRAALSGGGGQVQFYLQGPAGFSAGSTLDEPDPTNHSSNFGRGELARGDIDGDGDGDLILIHGFGNQQSSAARNRTSWIVDDGQGSLEIVAEWLSWEPFEAGDLDGDGDVDLYGREFVHGNGWEGLAGGAAQQYGEGTAGTGGYVPLFGVQGPYHKNSLTLTKQLRRGVGGGVALYAVGLAGAELPGFPTPFITTYVDPNALAALLTLPLDGVPGEPGGGSFDFPVSVQPYLTGFAFWEQVFVIDPGAPELISASNAMFVQLGN